MKRIAFVVQRAGREVNGGSESHCLSIATRMSAHWQVEILTTCALDYMTWNNYYPEGVEQIDGVTVRRFPVESQRDVEYFNQLSMKYHNYPMKMSVTEGKEWMHVQGPWSPDLLDYIKFHQKDYDVFIFFTYLYATTYFGLPLVLDRAILVPTAHDEWPIYLRIWDEFFHKPKFFIFNTPEERDFLIRRFPKVSYKGRVVGITVDRPDDISAERFRKKFGIQEPFLLYIGRIDPSKGCDHLFDYFLDLRKNETVARKLVLLGKAVMPIPNHPDILSLGFVDEQTKWDAIKACDLLIMPSPYESLSMVLLEAWSVGRPVLVNGACDVLVGQSRRAQGGLWYTNREEFRVAIEMMDSPTREILGRQGQLFVEQEYNWANIERAYLDSVAFILKESQGNS